jgi:hypothetical protein
MAAQEYSYDSWLWNHFSVINQTTAQCNRCIQKYRFLNNSLGMKVHLLHEHNIIFDLEEYISWNNDTDLIWQHFSKEDLYLAKCNICDILLFNGHKKSSLWAHLTDIHSETMNEIVNFWTSSHTKNIDAECINRFYANKICHRTD